VWFSEIEGKPASGVEQSDRDGRFRLVATSRQPYEIVAKDPDEFFLPSVKVQARAGASDVTLRLVEPTRFKLVARDETGACVTPVQVQIESARWSPSFTSMRAPRIELSAPACAVLAGWFARRTTARPGWSVSRWVRCRRS
jgi:hypothetical protein